MGNLHELPKISFKTSSSSSLEEETGKGDVKPPAFVYPDIIVRPFPEKDEKIIPAKRKIKIKRDDDVEDKRRTTLLR